MGKDFGGDAFITTPAIVEFKDFDVGQTYTAKVIITNRSYAKNTFRVLEVPPEYGSVLEASYDLPGHLATGVSANVMLTFTPKATFATGVSTKVILTCDSFSSHSCEPTEGMLGWQGLVLDVIGCGLQGTFWLLLHATEEKCARICTDAHKIWIGGAYPSLNCRLCEAEARDAAQALQIFSFADDWRFYDDEANEDISTHVDMLAETGPFQIPVR
eukprot:1161540-Pelagomonas_calceolata.AAC.21